MHVNLKGISGLIMRVYNIRIYIASIIEILYGINIKVYTRVYNVEIVKVFTMNIG